MGAPRKCNACGARWYVMGYASPQCRDCGSDDIDVDAGIPLADNLRRRSDALGDSEDALLMLDAAETIEWIATSLPVLRTMCRVAGLAGGEAKAKEMIESLERPESPPCVTDAERTG